MIPTFGNAGVADEKVSIDLQTKEGRSFKTIRVRRGTNLWVALRRFGIPVGASCSGVGVCGKCAVRVLNQGDSSVLSEPTELEKQTLDKQGLQSDVRLSCLCRVNSDLVVTADYW
jgi:ferredoxin